MILAGVCLTWPGKQLLGEVRVTGRGGTPRDLVRALVPRLVQDATSTFEWDLTSMEATMAPRQRRLRNYLLDAPLQLRFTAVLVLATLLGAGLLGIFLARALNRLAEQAERAVEARAAAAQASHELGNASLSRTLLERFNNPEFTAQLERQSRAIDAAYQAEQVQVDEQRREVARESVRIGWLVALSVGVFALAVLLIGIVLTHRIAGPVFRVRRLLEDLGQGRREVPGTVSARATSCASCSTRPRPW